MNIDWKELPKFENIPTEIAEQFANQLNTFEDHLKTYKDTYNLVTITESTEFQETIRRTTDFKDMFQSTNNPYFRKTGAHVILTKKEADKLHRNAFTQGKGVLYRKLLNNTNFDKELIVGVAAGKSRYGAPNISIKEVSFKDKNYRLKISTIDPKYKASTDMVSGSYPIAFARIKRLD